MFKSFRQLDFGSTKPEYISGFGIVRDRTQLGGHISGMGESVSFSNIFATRSVLPFWAVVYTLSPLCRFRSVLSCSPLKAE